MYCKLSPIRFQVLRVLKLFKLEPFVFLYKPPPLSFPMAPACLSLSLILIIVCHAILLQSKLNWGRGNGDLHEWKIIGGTELPY